MAIDPSGKAGQIHVVGFDVSDETLAAIEAGHIAGTIMQDQFGCGYETVRVLANMARGSTAEVPIFGKKMLQCRIVKKDNMQEARQRLSGAAPSTQPG